MFKCFFKCYFIGPLIGAVFAGFFSWLHHYWVGRYAGNPEHLPDSDYYNYNKNTGLYETVDHKYIDTHSKQYSSEKNRKDEARTIGFA